ncbi:MMEL1 [Mytilus edulis]|uniref:MMEL1 n=1 Tax=Mytilus edulis TaxID=6550 RepID=A0A8S3Q0V3_MYTED|nr:MMEL1 [Mytilus edulis]
MEENPCVKRSTAEKILCILFTVLLCVTFVLIGIVIFFATNRADQNEASASRILTAADFSVKPCDNFYEFACGKWMERNIVPEDKSYHATFTILRDEVQIIIKGLLENNRTEEDIESVSKAINLYKSCMNTDLIDKRDISVLFPVLEELGGWPVLGNSTGGRLTFDDYSLNELLGRLMRYYNSPLISMYVYQDYKQSNRNIIYMDQVSLLLPSRDYYSKGKDDIVIRGLTKVITTFCNLIGLHTDDVRQDVSDMIDFEIGLSKILTPREKRRDYEKRYNPFKVGDLNTEFGISLKHNFSLEGYLRETFSMKGVDIDLNDEDTVIIHDMNYTSQFIDFLDSYPPRTVANYVILRFLRNRLNNLPERFTDLILEISKLTDGRTVSRPRWQKCSSLVTSYIGLAVGRLFVKDNFAPDAKVGMSSMIKYIKESFNDILNELDWMDTDTMTVAEEKVSIDPNFYFDNILGLLNTAVKENLIKLRSKVFRLGWETSPSTVNAYYSSTDNRISRSLNFGAIGTLIGHEITHGFDDGGRQFDKDGRLDQWWNDSAIERFNEKTDCFKNQYGNFRLPEAGGIKMNGINTLGENIADNGGIKQSFRGYQKWLKHNGGEEKLLPGVNLTNNQLFFIAFAQIRCTNMRKKDAIGSILTAVHSPARFR